MLLRGVSVSVLLVVSVYSAELRGRVVDENESPVPRARVTVQPAGLSTQTDPTGAFRFDLPPGDYTLNVERAGYYALKNHPIHIGAALDVTLVVNTLREVFQSTDVNAETSPLDVGVTQNQETLTGTEVNDIPYANSHSLRNSLPIMPGVLLDPFGIHVNGSSENQVLYTLNGFNLTNPITGQLQTLLAVEGIRSVDVSSGRSSAEFGKGSAGVMAIQTESGTDSFDYTTTDFIPGLNFQHGAALGNWYPRVGVSGPIVRGRAWFSDMFESEYTSSVVSGLPSGQNTRSGWAGSNLLHLQINLTPSNLLYADFLLNVDNENRVGLGPLNPVSTTSTVHTREYFGSVKDQKYFGRGMLVEFGYAHNEFADSGTPQGSSYYLFSPQGNSGNYFLHYTDGAARDEALVQAYFPKFEFAGSHQIEAGAEVDLLRYNADFRRTGFEALSATGAVLTQTVFPEPAIVSLHDTEQDAFAIDTWRVTKRLQFDLAIRNDWDRRIGALAWSPRAAFSWSPAESARTKVSGGYAITHDAVTLSMLGQPYDQPAVTTVPGSPPVTTTFAIGAASLKLPRAANWTLNLDHQLAARLYFSAKYLRRRGTDGFAFLNTLSPDAPPSLLPLPGGESGGLYQLTNLRRDDYDSIQVTVRQALSGQFEWSVSYTRSRAQTNAVLDLNTTVPLQVLASLAPMPWDAPNRMVGWAYLPLPWKNWAVTALADLRTGFPFSVRNPQGVVVGPFDSYRYPVNFDLNLAIERMVTLRGYRFALRGGVDNLTDQANYTAVNNVTGTPQFLQFLGPEGRHFVVRIRFFGRATGK